MTDFSDFSQLCRLCLVEDDVNHSIFGETGEFGGLFRKITSCLPVSINKNDGLPVRICDTCSTKLDSFYQFRNETIKAEKQLLQWFHKNNSMRNEEGCMNTTVIKEEENIDYNEGSTTPETNNYTMMSKEIIYPTSTSKDEPPPSKRPKRASAMKALEHLESEDDDFDDNDYGKGDSDDDTDKDGSYQDEGPSTSMNDQPGPSGMGKGSSQAPLARRVYISERYEQCRKNASVEKMFPCKCCEEKNGNEHDETNLMEFPVKCPECRVNFLFKCEYLRHYLEMHELKTTSENVQKIPRVKNTFSVLKSNDGGFTCLECGKVFSARQSFRIHQKKQHENFRYVCDFCGKLLSELNSLKEHRRCHTGEKPFECTFCHKAFSRRTNLITHERTHSGLKPYECKMCEKYFTQRSSLNKHMKHHTGERPHICVICKKGFVTKTMMKIHLESHGVPNLKEVKTQPS